MDGILTLRLEITWSNINQTSPVTPTNIPSTPFSPKPQPFLFFPLIGYIYGRGGELLDFNGLKEISILPILKQLNGQVMLGLD